MDLKQSTIPLRKHIAEFLDYCEVERGLAQTTVRNYTHYLQALDRWLQTTNNHDLLPHQFTKKHVSNYRLYLARRHKSPTGQPLSKPSQNLYVTTLRSLLSYFAELEIEALPSSKVSLVKTTKERSMTVLELSDVLAMLEVPDSDTPSGLRDRTILELLFSTGMRVAELTALNVQQFEMLNDNNPERTYELSIIGKGRRARTVFISPRAADCLRAYLNSRRDVHAPLFINYRTNNQDDRRLTVRAIQKMIVRTALVAGVTMHVTPHTMRHSYATDLLAHGADLRSVQELLGHKNVATTQVYTHVTNKHLREIHQKHHAQDNDAHN